MTVKQAIIKAIVSQAGRPRGVAGRLEGWLFAHRPSNRQRNRIAELSRWIGPTGHVWGIDHSEVMIQQATRRNAAAIAAGRVTLTLGTVEALPPVLDGPFDVILAVNSLGFWPQPAERLEDLRRRLAPGGRIAIASQPRCPGATRATSLAAAREITDLPPDRRLHTDQHRNPRPGPARGLRPGRQPRAAEDGNELSMEFSKLLRRRRMVRSYRPEPVDQQALRRIVGVVHRAPSAGFSQGHRRVVVTSPELRAQIAGIAEAGTWSAAGRPGSRRRRCPWCSAPAKPPTTSATNSPTRPGRTAPRSTGRCRLGGLAPGALFMLLRCGGLKAHRPGACTAVGSPRPRRARSRRRHPPTRP
jgi:nitroreductase